MKNEARGPRARTPLVIALMNVVAQTRARDAFNEAEVAWSASYGRVTAALHVQYA